MKRAPFLPPQSDLGWTPYAWLVYLPTFVIQPAVDGAGAVEWALTALGIVVFLVSYFAGYWVRGPRLLAVIAVEVGLALAFAPSNAGAAVFFVYAASFAAQLDRGAARLIAGITVLALLDAWVLHAPAYAWITGGVFTPLIAFVNLHFAQVGRANHRLRRAHEEIEHLAAVAERERIARDLHDVLGHTLSLIVLKAQLAAKLAERDPARAAQEMRDVEQVGRSALTEVREAIRGYRARLGDEAEQARALLDAAGVRADLAVDPAALGVALDGAREDALALALREATTNVARHAGARAVSARLERAGDALVLSVEDDGRGAGPDAGAPGDGGAAAGGSGLRGMRERVEALGGGVTRVAGAGGRGTRLTVTVPLPAGTPPGAVPGAAPAAPPERAAS